MERFAVVARRPWRMLGALGALVVAVGATAGSGALFTTETANPSNTFSGGILDVASDDAGAILSASNLVPGQVVSGTTVISNTGNVAGHSWTLAQSLTAESAGDDPESAASGQLADVLNLKVEDLTAGTTEYDGLVRAFTPQALETIAPGSPHTYKFTVTLPSAADNRYEGATVDLKYVWSAVAGS